MGDSRVAGHDGPESIGLELLRPVVVLADVEDGPVTKEGERGRTAPT